MIVSRRTLGRFVVALVALFVSPSLIAQDAALRYRWTKGETQRYRSTTQNDMVMSGIPGMGDMTVTTTTVQVLKMVADDVAADGSATLRTVYESVKMTMNVPMVGEVVYDSADPNASAGNPMAESLKPLGAMVGQQFTMVVSPVGKLVKVDGLGALLDKARAGLASAGAGAALGGGDLSSILSEAAQKSSLEQAFMTVPEKPVKVGDSWKNAFTIPNPFGDQAVSQVYTVKSATAGLAQVSMAGAVKGAGKPGTMGPMTVNMGDGTQTGEVTFDVKLGRLRKMVTTLAMPMTMSMTGPDGSNINLQASSKATTTVELIEK